MSQLNNTNENIVNEDAIINNSNISKKKKLKSSTKIIIFLLIFTLCAIAFTIGAIYYTNNYPKEVDVTHTYTHTQIEDDGLAIQRLTEQYNENDLNIIDISEKKGTRTPKYLWDSDINKINIDYFKIDGLKNSTIENQINQEIKAFVHSLYSDKELENSQIDYIQIRAYVDANFANTLSVSISKSIFYIDENSETTTAYDYLNYNLVNGEKIKFSELFTNASLKNSLMQSIYDNIIDEYIYLNNLDGLIDMSTVDLSTVEEETYILLNKLMKNIDTLEFNFSPAYIYVKDYDLTIDMAKIYSSIAIYNRFKTTDSIFDGTHSGNKNMFVFSSRISNEDIQYSRYEDISDNFRVEVSIEMRNDLLSNKSAKKHLNDTISKVKNEISQIQKQANNTPNKAFVYTAYISMYNWESSELSNLNIENDILSISGETLVYEMSKKYYSDTFISEIAAFHNKSEKIEYWPVFTYYNEDNNNIKITKNSEINQDIDLYSNKEPDQLIGEYYINQHKTNLEELLNSLNNNIDCGDVDSYLAYVRSALTDIQKEYNFTNNDIKDVLTLIEEIKNAFETQKNSISTDIIIDDNFVSISNSLPTGNIQIIGNTVPIETN